MRVPIKPTRVPTRADGIYGSRWIREGWCRVGHVNFMLFAYFLFAVGTQRERVFWWNTGIYIFRNRLGCTNVINQIQNAKSNRIFIISIWKILTPQELGSEKTLEGNFKILVYFISMYMYSGLSIRLLH